MIGVGKLIDIHSHIIYGVDDGSKNIDESIKMLHLASKIGIKVIVATPHFHEHILNPEKTYNNFYILQEKAKNTGIDLKMGFEITLNPILLNAINLVIKHTINETQYILVDFPGFTFHQQSRELLKLLQKNRLKPIVAHPERNKWNSQNRKIINEIKDSGCLIQVNAGSIMGLYGKTAKKAAGYLLRKNIVDIVASDAHEVKYYSWYEKARQVVIKWTDEEYTHKIFSEQPKILVNTHCYSSEV